MAEVTRQANPVLVVQLRQSHFIASLLTVALGSPAVVAQGVTAQVARPAQAAQEVHATNTQNLAPLDGNPTLFAVLAAINAAGYDTDIDSPSNNPLRVQLRNHLASQNIPSVAQLRRFVRDHHLNDPTADLGQYISFALLSKGAPDFTPAMTGFPRPPDVQRLDELAPLLAAFYREANVPALWEASQPAYEVALAQYTDGASQAVQSVNGYLRNQMNPNTKGRFQVFVDLLGAPNQAHARTYLDEYFVVVTPSLEPRVEEIRHHYLRFWSDSLSFKYAPEIAKLRLLGDYALASPLLSPAYREDFSLLLTESFIKAVEARLDRNTQAVDVALREGYVLAPVFSELLPGYEKQQETLRNYFGEMLKQIDPRKEGVRLDKVDFASERQVRTVRVTSQVTPQLTGVAKVLEDAEEAFRNQQYAVAQEAWMGVLGSTEEPPAKARATYGLARLSLNQRDPEKADGLFRRVLEMSPDASTHSWTLLYLGKLADSQGEKDPAQDFYKRALAIEGLPEQVKREAEQGLTGKFFVPRPADEPDEEEDLDLEEDEDDL